MLSLSLARSNRCLLVLLTVVVASCSPSDQPATEAGAPSAAASSAGMPASDYDTSISIAEIMDAIVMREADVLWNAVSYSSTDDGFEVVGPETDEDWANLRYAAMSLAEATNSLLIPGRHANRPDVEAGFGELTPAEIDALISSQRSAWTGFAKALRASAEEAIDAIDARDTDRILDVGGTIDEACEACHLVFWYPNQ
jgi:hypothetical protein